MFQSATSPYLTMCVSGSILDELWLAKWPLTTAWYGISGQLNLTDGIHQRDVKNIQTTGGIQKVALGIKSWRKKLRNLCLISVIVVEAFIVFHSFQGRVWQLWKSKQFKHWFGKANRSALSDLTTTTGNSEVWK